jgi:HD-like signal output (HDOD) protein
MIKEKTIDLIRDRRTQLPTLPVVAANILKIVGNDAASTYQLADFISQDPAITNKILRLANSAYYGSAGKIDSILRAIYVIGFKEITSVTIGMGVFTTLSIPGHQELLDMKELWIHSIASSFMSKEIIKKVRLKGAVSQDFLMRLQSEVEQIFLCSLLHDIGKILFVIYFPEEYTAVLEETKREHLPLFQKEKELLGLDHGEMEGLIMEKWNFPEALLIPARYHHHLEECPPRYQAQAMVVELADFICHKAAVGQSGNPASYPSDHTNKILGLTTADIKEMSDYLKEQRPIIEQFLTAIS